MSVTIILGEKRDHHAQHMLAECKSRGVDVHLFDTSQFPQSISISWLPEDDEGFLHLDRETIKFSEIDSVFWSSIAPPEIDHSLPTESQNIARQDSMSMLKTFLNQRDIHWVNGWQSIQFHQQKPLQLREANKLGALIPETYIGNSVTRASDFCNTQTDCIYKPVFGGAHAQRLNIEQLSAQQFAKSLEQSPVTLQAFVKGKDIRTFVIGDKTYSAEIVSITLDYRKDPSPVIRPIQIPIEIEHLAVKICSHFGMAWTAIDWRRDEHGKFWFLEANPSPMFIFFEHVTGFPITEDLCTLLNAPQIPTKGMKNNFDRAPAECVVENH